MGFYKKSNSFGKETLGCTVYIASLIIAKKLRLLQLPLSQGTSVEYLTILEENNLLGVDEDDHVFSILGRRICQGSN